MLSVVNICTKMYVFMSVKKAKHITHNCGKFEVCFIWIFIPSEMFKSSRYMFAEFSQNIIK